MITSVQNPIVKLIEGLREPKIRREKKLTIIDGLREIERALQAGIAIKQLVYCEKLLAKYQDSHLVKTLKTLDVTVTEVNERLMERLSFGQRIEGILAIVQTPALTLAQLHLSRNPLVVVLESVEKPGNLGAVLRSCDGASVEAVLIADSKTDIYNPNVIRASTGIVFSLPVIAATVTEIQEFLNQHKLHVYAATPHAKDKYTDGDYRTPTAFVLGCEDKGLTDQWLKGNASTITIPMMGRADSLNVSVTTSILVYEALRQRQSKER